MECPVCGKSAKIRKKQIMEYSTITHYECSDEKCAFRWVKNDKISDEKKETSPVNSSDLKTGGGGFHFTRKN